MKEYIEKLKAHISAHPPELDDADSVLALLYEVYNAINTIDDDRIKADFNALYQAMNGMELKEMDRIIDPVCTLCRDHERAGFVEGIKVGIRLAISARSKCWTNWVPAVSGPVVGNE